MKLLVVKLAGLGDLLTAFPAMEALRDRFPDAEITALVTPRSAPLLDGSGLADRVLTLDKYVFDTASGFANPVALVRLARFSMRLRAEVFDTAVLLHHLLTPAGVAKYGLLMTATGARVRAGLDDGRGWFLNLTAPDRGFGAAHEVEYWLEVVSLLGAASAGPRPRLRAASELESDAERLWQEARLGDPRETVVVHPGTGAYSPARRWPADRFAIMADGLRRRHLAPMLLAGPGEEQLAGEVASSMRRPAPVLAGIPSPNLLGALLRPCAAFVGNDSGAMHIAAASGVPVVAVFGPSNDLAWGPYDPDRTNSRVVSVDIPCRPCMYRGQSLGLRYGCGDYQCLTRIEPAAVLSAVSDLLKAAASRDTA